MVLLCSHFSFCITMVYPSYAGVYLQDNSTWKQNMDSRGCTEEDTHKRYITPPSNHLPIPKKFK